TDVRVTGDLQHATVFYTVMGTEEEREGTAAALASATGILRREVGRQTGGRLTPTLEVILDAIPANARASEDVRSEARESAAELARSKQGAQYTGDADPYRTSPEDDEDSEGPEGEAADAPADAPGTQGAPRTPGNS